MPVKGEDQPMEPGAPWWNRWEVGNDNIATGNTIRADVGTSSGSKARGTSQAKKNSCIIRTSLLDTAWLTPSSATVRHDC